MNKQILIDAVIGKGFSDMHDAIDMTNLGLSEFCGDQNNEKWKWIRSKLEDLSEEYLEKLYFDRPRSEYDL
jgi:UDP-glucose 6-dehydrogenase